MSDTKIVSMPIQGMTCASCVGHAERALTKVDRVTDASVNLTTEKATATCVPGITDLPELRQAVADAGYEPG